MVTARDPPDTRAYKPTALPGFYSVLRSLMSYAYQGSVRIYLMILLVAVVFHPRRIAPSTFKAFL